MWNDSANLRKFASQPTKKKSSLSNRKTKTKKNKETNIDKNTNNMTQYH